MQAKVTVPWERSAALNRITPHDVWSEAARTALNHRAQVRPRHHLCWRLGSASRLGPSSNTRPHLGLGQAPDQRGTTQSPFPTCGINEICWVDVGAWPMREPKRVVIRSDLAAIVNRANCPEP